MSHDGPMSLPTTKDERFAALAATLARAVTERESPSDP